MIKPVARRLFPDDANATPMPMAMMDNNTRQTIHDYIGSVAFMPNEPKILLLPQYQMTQIDGYKYFSNLLNISKLQFQLLTQNWYRICLTANSLSLKLDRPKLHWKAILLHNTVHL